MTAPTPAEAFPRTTTLFGSPHRARIGESAADRRARLRDQVRRDAERVVAAIGATYRRDDVDLTIEAYTRAAARLTASIAAFGAALEDAVDLIPAPHQVLADDAPEAGEPR